jgi:hypothetical protein
MFLGRMHFYGYGLQSFQEAWCLRETRRGLWATELATLAAHLGWAEPNLRTDWLGKSRAILYRLESNRAHRLLHCTGCAAHGS